MEKTCTSLFGAVFLVVFSREARTQQKDCRARGSEGLKVLVFNRSFTYFVLRAINFVKSSHQSRFPVLVLSNLILANVANESACAGLSWGFLFFFSALREDVQCLSLRNRTGAAAQGSFFKVNKKCSQRGSCLPLCCVRRVYLTGWWNQINWLYYTSVSRGDWVICRLI